jgi:hypothetical protein
MEYDDKPKDYTWFYKHKKYEVAKMIAEQLTDRSVMRFFTFPEAEEREQRQVKQLQDATEAVAWKLQISSKVKNEPSEKQSFDYNPALATLQQISVQLEGLREAKAMNHDIFHQSPFQYSIPPIEAKRAEPNCILLGAIGFAEEKLPEGLTYEKFWDRASIGAKKVFAQVAAYKIRRSELEYKKVKFYAKRMEEINTRMRIAIARLRKVILKNDEYVISEGVKL